MGARTLLEESLAINRELGDCWSIANCLSSLGDAALTQKDSFSTRIEHRHFSCAINRNFQCAFRDVAGRNPAPGPVDPEFGRWFRGAQDFNSAVLRPIPAARAHLSRGTVALAKLQPECRSHPAWIARRTLQS